MVVEIPLSQELVALVDDEDVLLVQEHRWYANHIKGRRKVYAVRQERNADTGKISSVLMHRVIMGARQGQEVDHIDHNGLNNLRSNLRVCTRSENQQNARKQIRDTTSKYKGVYSDKAHGKWAAGIGINNRNIFLGYFDSETDAARAYDAAALEHFGEFALLNLTDVLAAEPEPVPFSDAVEEG